ncbi:MAG TPA: phosphoribosylanthranilate isomerase [Leucothrix mucor]|uniref:N-(5'-phosphoribosyl)anthranilate isomerase n=1 Tax=Leucothrix mucor TaxID=45248 RepID=A0A7V2WVT3_LEUMU|nr:phosphoribosylanthranilate isomerase [Leucothrix mucor]
MAIKVKICGITSVNDALAVSDSGADAIGLVFYPKSSRYVSIQQATEICAALPPFISVVGLFLDASQQEVEAVLEQVPLDLLQFHGSESPPYCASFSRPYIKAVGMIGLDDFARYADQYPDAKAFLVDGHAPGAAGGTGNTFDWNDIPTYYPKPIILAGGLNPDNIAVAIKSTSVYAVDLSSGVESAPGIKSKQKMTALMQQVNEVNCVEQ